MAAITFGLHTHSYIRVYSSVNLLYSGGYNSDCAKVYWQW